MSSTKVELDLKLALLGTGLVQPVESIARAGHVEVLCRLVPGQEKAWLRVVEAMLRAAASAGLSVLLARRYVLKDGRLVFGWHVQVEAKAKLLGAGVAVLVEELAKARPQLEAVPEPGVVVPFSPQTPPPQEGVSPPEEDVPARPRRPPGIDSSIRVVRRETDPVTGTTIIEEEMPLPHVTRDLNVPTAKGKGATRTAPGR